MSSMSGTETAWSVEARSSGGRPVDCGNGFILDAEWRPVPLVECHGGVPGDTLMGTGRLLGLLSYQAAQALRWWFLANMNKINRFSAETRLVCHKVTYELKSEVVGSEEAIGSSSELRVEKTIRAAAELARAQGEKQ